MNPQFMSGNPAATPMWSTPATPMAEDFCVTVSFDELSGPKRITNSPLHSGILDNLAMGSDSDDEFSIFSLDEELVEMALDEESAVQIRAPCCDC